MRFLLAALVACATIACDSPTLPTPPPKPPPVDPPPPPPFNPGVDFSWTNTRGILWFPATQADEGQIRAAHHLAKAVGYPTITWHVCSEVVEWEGTGLLDPPWQDVYSEENLSALRRFLRVTADLGDQVLLDVFCTVRDNHRWMEANWSAYSQKVAEIATPYNHVAIHVANEPWHPRSWLRDKETIMRNVKDIFRQAGFRGPIGADDNIGCAGCSFQYTYRGWADWSDFHPYRNPNPTAAALRRIYRENSLKPVVISEPTAYGRDGGCCTTNFAEIQRYICDGEDAGLVMFYHSREGLEGLSFSTLPGQCR